MPDRGEAILGEAGSGLVWQKVSLHSEVPI
jgi:hypothetical protein